MASVPEHLNDFAPQREAFAPYNFIPLPEKAVPAEQVPLSQRVIVKAEPQPAEAQYLVRHDQYFADRHTGTISCTLKTETPLYVRCGLTEAEFEASIKEVELQQQSNEARTTPTKNKPDFFASPGQRAIIPGSSLRGLLRSLVEIVSHSKIDLVTRKNLFFRSVDKTNLGEHYRKRMTNQIRAGFLRLQRDGGVIEETTFYKIPISILEQHIRQRYTNYRRTKLPNERHQYQKIWVKPRNNHKIAEMSLSERQGDGWLPATLVITGDVPGKKHEYVLIQQIPQQTFRIENEQLQRFHDEDQLSQWQTQAFPQRNGFRERKGQLANGDPIFFIVDPYKPQQVSFFGRAGMFRLPYTNSPYDLIPLHLRTGGADAPLVDLTEAMFGFVHREATDDTPHITSYASRLRFSDAKLVDQEIAESQLWDTETTPPILASPKPTTFQHYLTQEATELKSLRHYGDDRTDTTIRGHKQYWHHGRFNAAERHDPEASADSTQSTQLRPVKAGVEFQFHVTFENLSDVELGALIYVLELAASPHYRLKLGMGKPYGFGSIAINYQIAITDRQVRYSRLFNQPNSNWLRAELDLVDEELLAKRQAFCEYILQQSGEQARGVSEFNLIPRIQQLLAMLEWDTARFEQTEPRPWAEVVRYLEIERKVSETWVVGDPVRAYDETVNEYRLRPVLPTPLRVINRRLVVPRKPEKPLQVNQTVSGTIVGRVNKQIWDVRLDNKKIVFAKVIGNSINPQHLNNGKRVAVRIISLEDDAVQEIRKIQ
ncbi:TIGR03986 family CRISPR-associated RAMP protein [Herpetosiphon giganteus]|uniref:TIGR03986 family type III CRISPR-associated RAMP protein n=1 Tax=Herpetosiphon giganteus TaxID=2029754 RepID=UPI00195C6845|nr:TIGR03986 family CRISPR-associated RAMP protein [Herpetosiphon giganteus]MBM7844808.1 CRISPR-associated protein (TIGR03986 family) [Herpetosiphon giganteus]